MEKIISNNSQETQEIARAFAEQLLLKKPGKRARVLALCGDLGAGKTTFLQGFAKGLGITETVNSPTFVIMKRFKIYDLRFKNFYHFDLYRLENEKDVEFLEIKEILSDPENIVAIEWPERAESVIPGDAIAVDFSHYKESQRVLTINYKYIKKKKAH